MENIKDNKHHHITSKIIEGKRIEPGSIFPAVGGEEWPPHRVTQGVVCVTEQMRGTVKPNVFCNCASNHILFFLSCIIIVYFSAPSAFISIPIQC